MRPQGPSAVVRRLWPQRLRTRLAVFYSLLFFSAGLGLMALAYTLAIERAGADQGAEAGAADALRTGRSCGCANRFPARRHCSRSASTCSGS